MNIEAPTMLMTEEQWWMSTDDLKGMLMSRYRHTSERKVRLFACACIRRACQSISDQRLFSALEVIERYADSLADARQLGEAFRSAMKVVHAFGPPQENELNDEDDLDPPTDHNLNYVWSASPDYYTALAVVAATKQGNIDRPYLHSVVETSIMLPPRTRMIGSPPTPIKDADARIKFSAHANLLREILGNPFHRLFVEECWRTANGGIVQQLAEAVYQERDLPSGCLDNTHLAVLADALEEAGCTNAEILTHLRCPGPHVRGCWALDLILAKT